MVTKYTEKFDINPWFIRKDEEKTALVLGGGGARGCYEIGAWQAFEQAGIRFDIVAGTSIGALVGAIYTQQTLEPIVEFVNTLKPTAIAADLFDFPENIGSLLKERRQIRDFLDEYILSARGMDISPLKEAIDGMFDYRKFKDSPINFACMTFNVSKRRPEAYFKDEMHQWNSKDIILASASCYPAFPMLEMDGEYYIDGGYWSNVPIDLAKRMGAVKALAIDVEGPGLIQPVPRGIDVLTIKPMLPLGNFLDFDQETCIRSMHIGYLEISKFLGMYCGYLFTFTRDYLQDMYFTDGYLQFMFRVTGIPVSVSLCSRIVKSTAGFHRSSLSQMRSQDYMYGEMVEALAYSIGIDPVRLYSYYMFIQELLRKLQQIRLEPFTGRPESIMSWLHSLSREGLLAVFHRLIRDEDGLYKEYMNVLKSVFPAEFYLAWVWYFLEGVYERVSVRTAEQ